MTGVHCTCFNRDGYGHPGTHEGHCRIATVDRSDEPCMCGTDFTCMADVHDEWAAEAAGARMAHVD